MENFKAINKHGGVYLTKIHDFNANSLLLEVKNSIVSDHYVDLQVEDYILSQSKEITIDKNAAFFTIYFNRYVSYHVINESYDNSDPAEDYDAGDFGTFCVFHKSSYMDFILKATIANDLYPGELKHYGLFAANHVVHVISKDEPIIEIEMPSTRGE
jgi:hypothetical protein